MSNDEMMPVRVYKVILALYALLSLIVGITCIIWSGKRGEAQGRAEQEAKDKANAPAPIFNEIPSTSVCPQVLPNFNGGDTSKTDFDKVIKENNDARREADKSMSGVLAAAEQLDKSIDHLGASLGLCWSKSKETWISCPSGKPHKAAPKVPAVIDVEPGAPFTVGNGWTFTCITADFEKRTVTGTCPKDPPASLQGPPMFSLPQCTKDTNGLCTSPVAQLE